MARTTVSRRILGRNSLHIVGNADLNLATSYAEIVGTFSGGAWNGFDPDASSWTLSLFGYFLHVPPEGGVDYNYGTSVYAQTDSNGGSASGSGVNTGRNWMTLAVTTGILNCFLGGVTRNSSLTPVKNTWYMLTLVRNKSAQTLKWYINKTPDTSFSSVASFESCTGKHRIGANRGTVRAMDGYVGEVLLESIAYSDAQVVALYDTGAIVGTPVYRFMIDQQSGSPLQTGSAAVTMTLNNTAAIEKTVVPFPSRTPVVRTPVARTPA